MKKLIFLLSVIVLFSCQKQSTSPPELIGTWKLVSFEVISKGTLLMNASDDSIEQLKSWSEQHFVFAGKTTSGNQASYSFGNWSYTLSGKRYTEKIKVHTSPAYEGRNVKILLEIKGDTLVQIFPAKNDWSYDKENFWIEKYVKVE